MVTPAKITLSNENNAFICAMLLVVHCQSETCCKMGERIEAIKIVKAHLVIMGIAKDGSYCSMQ